ncbi:MAG: OmpA family protein, partial [Bacteroidales bacterium]
PGKTYKGLYREKFRMNVLHADFMWNATNAICGYNSERIWNVIPFAGFGVAQSHGNGNRNNEFVAAAGILNTFRVSNRVDINLEARQLIMKDNQDGVVYGKRVDGMTSLTAGVSVKLGKTGFNRIKAAVPADYSAYTSKINELNNTLRAQIEKENELRALLALEMKKEPQKETEIQTVTTPVALFFSLGKSTLDEKELLNLDFYVKTAIAKDANKVFTLIGSADKETGTAKFNEELSKKRVDFVYNLLVDKYGVAPARLVKQAEGSSDNQFSSPELNRVVVIK